MTDLERVRSGHQRILQGLGLLMQPWVILGGAPDPHLPPALLASHARVDINNSGLAAAGRGLGRADLTVRRPSEAWDVHPDLDTRALLWFSPRSLLRLRWKLLRQRRARVGTLIRMSPAERESVVASVIGGDIRAVGQLGKPSNGIAALCYGLYVGVPEIVLAGISVTRQGHSYDSLARPRMQMEEDMFALGVLRDDLRVATTEPDLAAATGVRLWTAQTSGLSDRRLEDTLEVRP